MKLLYYLSWSLECGLKAPHAHTIQGVIHLPTLSRHMIETCFIQAKNFFKIINEIVVLLAVVNEDKVDDSNISFKLVCFPTPSK